MSKLDELIAELCPNGVEYVRLAECCDIEDNKRKPVKSSLRIPGDTPYYGANNIQDYVEGYTHYGQYVLIAEDGSASLENYSVQYVDGFFWANNHVHVIKGRKDLDTKFLYYYLTSFNFIPFLTGGTRAKLNKGNMEKIPVPLPPLPVQQEIVRILDNFTELTTELTALKQQYEYYRDELLTFGDEVEYVRLGEVLDYEQPTKYIVKSTNYDDNFELPVLTAGESFILGYTDEIEGIYKANKNNPVIIFDDFTTSFHWVDFNFKVKSSAMKMLKLSNKTALFRYIYHCMRNISFIPSGHRRRWIREYSEIEIPLPPLPVQEEIVRILDNFTELTTELTAEIEARQKQYEYYRDKLLSFKEVTA